MGYGSSYYDDVRTARQHIGATRAATRETFAHSTAAEQGKVESLHPDMNIFGPKVRESRDTPSKPNKTPVALIFDVTGSNRNNVPLAWKNVPTMMGLLNGFDIVPDPEILWGAVGDVQYHRNAPIQIGQYEVGKVLDEQLAKLFLKEDGGGNAGESYELIAYYFSRHVLTDSLERRGKPGYLGFFADEEPQSKVDPQQVREWIGDSIGKAIPTRKIFDELRQKFVTFGFMTGGASYDGSKVYEEWAKYMPREYLLKLPNPEALVHTYIAAMALHSGSMTFEEIRVALEQDWKATPDVAAATLKSITPLAESLQAQVEESVFQ